MKKVILTCIAAIILSSTLPAQPSVERIGWLPYWGAFHAVAVSGDIALTISDYGLLSFDISDPTQPELLDSFPIQLLPYGSESEIQIFGDIANVQAGKLYRFNISDPANLELLPGLPENPQPGNEFVQVGDYIYTVAQSHLYVINVSDPDNPVVADSTLIVNNWRLIGQDRLLIAHNDVPEQMELTIISIQDAESPDIVGSYRSQNHAYPDWNWNPQVIGSRFYAGTTDFNTMFLECVDFSDPAEPFQRWIKNWDYPYMIGSYNDLLAVIRYMGEERLIGLYSSEDPDTLIEVAQIRGDTYPKKIASQENTVYLASDLGLHSFDVTDLDSIQLLGGFRSHSCRNHVTKIGDYLTVALNDSTLRVISVENSQNPVEVSSYDMEIPYFVHCTWTHPNNSMGLFT